VDNNTELALGNALDLLRRSLRDRLEHAEFLATCWEGWSEMEAEAARGIIEDLVQIVRGFLRDHKPTPERKCARCESPWPCQVVAVIHEVMTDPERRLATFTYCPLCDHGLTARRCHDCRDWSA